MIDGFENQTYEAKIAPEITGLGLPDERAEQGEGAEESVGRPNWRRRKSPRNGSGQGRDGAGRFGLLNEPQPVMVADANVDFKVTLTEWLAATDRRFALLDTTGAGKLTLETLPPIPGAHRPKH